VPANFEFFWQAPEPVYDPAKAKQLLAEAGHPNGFEAGAFYCDAAFSSIAEAVVNNLREAGIRTNLQPVERAAFYKGYGEKKFKNLIMGQTVWKRPEISVVSDSTLGGSALES
jgi:peptide/nickel transport system substrate-binding protein